MKWSERVYHCTGGGHRPPRQWISEVETKLGFELTMLQTLGLDIPESLCGAVEIQIGSAQNGG